jgi:hypothetical protein
VRLPWFARFILVDPAAVEAGLARLRRSGAFADVPNAWQVTLGVLRMWHRVLLRSETIGLSAARVRETPRGKLLRNRAVRFPFLVAERAIAPLDFSGLISGRERILRHLLLVPTRPLKTPKAGSSLSALRADQGALGTGLGAHHDGDQFVYDLELLRAHPGALDELRARTAAIVDGSDPRADYLRDLVVFEGYHESLLAAVDRALAGDFGVGEIDATNPDISLSAYLAWCARQPPSWEATRDTLRRELATKLAGVADRTLERTAEAA